MSLYIYSWAWGYTLDGHRNFHFIKLFWNLLECFVNPDLDLFFDFVFLVIYCTF